MEQSVAPLQARAPRHSMMGHSRVQRTEMFMTCGFRELLAVPTKCHVRRENETRHHALARQRMAPLRRQFQAVLRFFRVAALQSAKMPVLALRAARARPPASTMCHVRATSRGQRRTRWAWRVCSCRPPCRMRTPLTRCQSARKRMNDAVLRS